jgi:Sulfotransferase family
MERQLSLTLADEDRFHIDFAIAKAYEDRRDWGKAFAHYEAGNNLRAKSTPYDGQANRARVTKSAALFTKTFFDERAGGGHHADDPIFILGMPRAGSTLIEQILSSHSMIEGTQELPDIGMMANRITGEHGLDAIAALTPEKRAALGAEYLERTRINRKSDKQHFIDKMPNNWQHLALIHLILPNAKIIDARRHPLDCCFSNYRQHFARGQSFAYGLADVGAYYCDYVTAMAAIDTALPGRIHRVIHEHLVDDTEAEVRAMLAYLDVPFEESCLRFWENDRAVQTPSAEQVRRPINKEGVDRWKPYDAWLAPLRQALGPVLATYPAVP